ncbi:hypothetical protein L1987_02208 [Smallanthus sonchifolius]|uniref:Uncharacterized protein n=1 Tax=Smallanthus sonchifolius TaxID=185202 RepID=A0ACB9K766_9ASTR|nr:hypothetical protein L1987_02208 [Smallanthus sonchifolius]
MFSIFIFLFSFTLSLYSYTQNLSIYTAYNDRNFIFLICNGILAFLFINSSSTHVSSPKENQSVSTYEIKRQTLIMSSAMEEQEEKREEDGDEIDHDARSIIEYKTDDQYELEDAAETEELNKKCAEFIRKMRERMISESLRGRS